MGTLLTSKGGKTIKINLNLSNPKTYLALMLFFGGLFVLIGQTSTGNAMIAGSAGLWVFKEFKNKARYRR